MIGDVLDSRVLERAGVVTARVVLLACENDSATLLAATVVRNYAPDVPIIAGADLTVKIVAALTDPGSICTFLAAKSLPSRGR